MSGRTVARVKVFGLSALVVLAMARLCAAESPVDQTVALNARAGEVADVAGAVGRVEAEMWERPAIWRGVADPAPQGWCCSVPKDARRPAIWPSELPAQLPRAPAVASSRQTLPQAGRPRQAQPPQKLKPSTPVSPFGGEAQRSGI